MMNPMMFAHLLAMSAASNGPDALPMVVENPPKRHPRLDTDVPADFYAAEMKKLQRPPTAEQNAAVLKRARKNLVRLVQGSASGEQIAAAWEVFEAAGGNLKALPTGVFDAVVMFAFTSRPIVAAWSDDALAGQR